MQVCTVEQLLMEVVHRYAAKKGSSKKFRKISWQTPVSKSPVNKVGDQQLSGTSVNVFLRNLNLFRTCFCRKLPSNHFWILFDILQWKGRVVLLLRYNLILILYFIK